jgi:hypothetical protein
VWTPWLTGGWRHIGLFLSDHAVVCQTHVQSFLNIFDYTQKSTEAWKWNASLVRSI